MTQSVITGPSTPGSSSKDSNPKETDSNTVHTNNTQQQKQGKEETEKKTMKTQDETHKKGKRTTQETQLTHNKGKIGHGRERKRENTHTNEIQNTQWRNKKPDNKGTIIQ